jgi:glycerol-3-phosphate O-acyltransferase
MTSGGIMNLARRLLHLWVRLRTFPEVTINVDPARPVCYVLRENWLTDHLVLREAVARAGLPAADQPLKLGKCRLASAEFSLTVGWRLFGKARDIHGIPPRLARLIEALAADPTVDVQIVPVTVLWGRAPKQQDGILRALLAESWQRRHPLGHWLAVILHGRQTHVHFGQPYSLRALLTDVPEPARAAKKAARVLRAHFRRQRELAIGPDVSHRHTQVEALLATPEMRAAITAEAERHQIAPEEARDRARRHVLAIASDYSYNLMRAGELFLTWVWTRLFDGVEVRNLEALMRVASGQSIVYLPCHRSHIDYLLMTYVIFRAGLTPPHVAAGDNLDLPVLGRILRGGGGFFLRRSFKGDPLYATVFAEYLHRMLALGFPIEYFIEGGRSRNGRMLPPKAGLLAMTVQSFLRWHERPLVFVPIYLGYEKLPEGASFVGELSGQPKQRESLLGLLSAVRVLRRHFGKVYVNFGEPLPLADWLEARHPDWRSTSNEGDWQRAAVGAIAGELTRRINDAALVNPVNLVGLALLATPRATAAADALARQIEHLLALLDAVHLAAPADGAACIAAALKLAAVRRVEHPLGALIEADAHEAALLAYFRNNVLHLYALPTLVACLIVQHGPLERAKLQETVADLFSLMRTSLYLRLEERDLPQALDDVVARLVARGLIERDGEVIREPAANTLARADLHWLAEILRPQMERYFLVLMVLRHAGSGHLTRVELLERSVLLGQRLALMHAGTTPEFADKPLFVALVDHLLDNGILHEDALKRLGFGGELERAAVQAEALLAPDVRELMLRLSLE